MSRLRVGLALAVLLLACERPVVGEPCHGGSPYMDREAGIYLFCYGPPGCDEPDLRWRHLDDLWVSTGHVYCTCSGQTRRHELEQPPNVPWQFFGSCEQPCADLCYGSFRQEFVPCPGPQGPVPPECQSACEGATIDDRRCLMADGRIAPRDCCDCEGAFRDDEGACISGRHETLQISEDCCPG